MSLFYDLIWADWILAEYIMYMSQTYIIPEVIYVLEEGSVTKTKIRNVTIQFSDHLHVCRRQCLHSAL